MKKLISGYVSGAVILCIGLLFCKTLILQEFPYSGADTGSMRDKSVRINGESAVQVTRNQHGYIPADPDPEPRYRNATAFLEATPDDVIIAPKMSFIQDVKNPCFAITEDGLNPTNVTLGDVGRNGWRIACLPYVYLAGFTKSGTSDLFKYFTKHPLFAKYGKEMHWWDNMRCDPTKNMATWVTVLSKPTQRVISRLMGDTSEMNQVVIPEGTPRTVWHGDHWQYDVINQGLDEPIILSPQKIHHVTPQSRIIVIMRDPTSRLISDYKYYVRNGRGVDGSDFHDKVARAIDWWNTCLEKHTERRCLYGPTPEGMPTLDIDNCIVDRAKTWQYITDPKLQPCHSYFQWVNNSAARLRVGLYERFIAEWLDVFPREQMLFIKFEEYISDPLDTIQNHIYPFLGVPKLDGKDLEDLRKDVEKNTGSNKSFKDFEALPETIEMLREFYLPYNILLSKLLQDEKWIWNI